MRNAYTPWAWAWPLPEKLTLTGSALASTVTGWTGVKVTPGTAPGLSRVKVSVSPPRTGVTGTGMVGVPPTTTDWAGMTPSTGAAPPAAGLKEPALPVWVVTTTPGAAVFRAMPGLSGTACTSTRLPAVLAANPKASAAVLPISVSLPDPDSMVSPAAAGVPLVAKLNTNSS
jgi:hypothetical protein